jgi:RimJ/RimL family protein N-acetyltransferase
MRHRDVTRDDVPALIDVAMGRCPHLQAWWVTGLFADGVDVDVARVVESPDGVPVAFGAVTHRHGRPEHQRWVNVFVSREVEGEGVAGALLADCLAAVAPGTTELWAQVFDDDERSMAVAAHWGFETVQLSITSVAEIDPATAPYPDVPDGITVEACGDLDPPDPEAFDAMLTASQTNPEARSSHVMTRDEMRGWVDEGEQPLGSMVRVDGTPAAVTFGGVVPADGIGGVGYTGVDPRFRGQGLARLAKQHLHHQAAGLGVRRLYTDNEENNHGIRRVNAALGYVPDYGLFRLRKRLRQS